MLPASATARFVTPRTSPSWTNTVHVMIHATQSSLGGSALPESRRLATRPAIVDDRSPGLIRYLNQDCTSSGHYASTAGPARQMSSRSMPCRYADHKATLFGSQCLICSLLKDVPLRLRLPHTLRARFDYRSGRCCWWLVLAILTTLRHARACKILNIPTLIQDSGTDE
jgi:hypothetical protein